MEKEDSIFTKINNCDSIKLPLSKFEKVIINFNKCGDCIVGCLGIVEKQDDSSHELDADLAKRALNYLIERHPLMRANVVEVDGHGDSRSSRPFDSNHFFSINNKRTSCDDFTNCFKWIRTESREQMIAKMEELNQELFNYTSSTDSIWRLNIYEHENKYGVFFVMPLVICDGFSICTIVIEFINIANALMLNQECIEMKEKLDLVGNVNEIILKKGLANDEKCENIKKLMNRLAINSRLPCIFKSSGESGLKLSLFKLDVDLTKKLVDYTKAHKIKMTGLVSTIVIYSLKDLYEENGIRFPKDFMFGISANFRIRVDPMIDFSHLRYLVVLLNIDTLYPEFGKFDSILEDSIYINDKIAKETNLEDGSFLRQHLDSEGIDLFVDWKDDPIGYCESAARYLTYDLIISNTGDHVYKYKKQNPKGPFIISEIYYGDSIVRVPQIEAGVIFHLSYWNDQMMFQLSTNRSAIGSAYSNRLIELIQQNFKRFFI